MPKFFTPAQMLAYLKDQVDKAPSQKQFAEVCGVSQAYLSDILRGRRPIPDQVLRYIGYRRCTERFERDR